MNSPFSTLKKKYLRLRYLALTISILFHPVFITPFHFTYTSLLNAGQLVPFSNNHLLPQFLSLILITTVIVPLLMISVHFYFSGKPIKLDSYMLSNHKERIYPFLNTAFYFTGITYLFYNTLNMNDYICSFMSMVSLSLYCIAFISIFYKISAHALASSAWLGYSIMLGFISVDYNYLYEICGLTLLLGFICSARIFLKAHDSAQLIWGIIVGIVCAFINIIWFL
jgi:hypothetical protein